MLLTLRPARESDLEAMTSIAIAAFPFDPQWPYRYPHRLEHPEEHERYVRLGFKEYLRRSADGVNDIMLVEVSSEEDCNATRVVAFSIWDSASANIDGQAVPPATNYFQRKDGNPLRMRAYLNATMSFRQKVFVAKYGKRQMSLRQMATHPDYWRRGAGRLAIKWGIEKAAKERVTIVLFASPMGKKLYETFGFRELDTACVQIPGEKESLNLSVFAWDKAMIPKVLGGSESDRISMD